MKRSFFNIFKGKAEEDTEIDSGSPSSESQSSKKGSKEIEPETTEKANFAKDRLEQILTLSDLGGVVEIGYLDNSKVELNISDTDELGRIIGKDGVAINSLQILIRQMIYQKFNSGIRIQIDAADYKRKRERTLRNDSLKLADKIKSGVETRVELDPMNPSERRYVHSLFQDDVAVKSYSIGEGKSRRIVLEKED